MRASFFGRAARAPTKVPRLKFLPSPHWRRDGDEVREGFRVRFLSSLHNRDDYENKAGKDNDDDGKDHRHA